MANLVIGLTGGIGSGKTAVSDWFYKQGIDIVDADHIAHQITQQGNPILEELKNAFGDWVLDKRGNYNRAAMRQYIFDKSNELQKLNAIIHPAIRQEITKQLDESQSPYTILSVPLLFENYNKQNSLVPLCQHFLVVDVNEQTQLIRASQRDNANTTNIQAIINQQISRNKRLALAKQLKADIVDNSEDLIHLHKQLQPLHGAYLALSNQL